MKICKNFYVHYHIQIDELKTEAEKMGRIIIDNKKKKKYHHKSATKRRSQAD